MYTYSFYHKRRQMFRTFVTKWGLVLGLLMMGSMTLSAQDCTAYERELQEYFLAHQTEDRLNMTRIESVYKSCSQPTEKMELIFYYFQAIHAINSTSYHDYRTYEAATLYYDQSARYFPFLIQAGPEEDTFVETYFAKAFELEQWLQREARRLRYSPENRYYGETEDALWARSDTEHAREAGKARGQAETEQEFKRKFRQSDRYVDQLPPFLETSAGLEPFGYVGLLDNINMIDYLDWQRSDELTTTARLDPRLLNPDRAAWIESLNSTPGAYQALMSIQDHLAIRQNPSPSAPVVDHVSFGEVLARVTKYMPVIDSEITFLPVRSENGKAGWIAEPLVVEQGKLAVCITNTPAYTRSNQRADRNAVVFFAGEMIVLEGAREGWLRVVGRNGRKKGWISGTEFLSIDPIDLHIGEKMFDALQSTSIESRKVQLESIRTVYGYKESNLSPYVERLINQYRL